MLGEHLGVQRSILDEIRNEYSTASVEEQMIHMLACWMKSGASFSWSDIITALRCINENTLADELHSEFFGTFWKNLLLVTLLWFIL